MNDQHAFLNRLIDLSGQAERQYRVTATVFLTPAEQAAAGPFLRNRRITFSLDGGYDQAERKRCLFWPSPEMPPDQDEFIAVTEITPAQSGLGHRDYLGSLLGLGLKREQLGDIIVLADRALVIHHPSLQPFFLTQLERVGSCPVHCRQSTIGETDGLAAAEPEQLTATVSSLRVDVVLGAIFHSSRSQSLELIRRGLVQVDWVECAKPDQILVAGQTVTVRGEGRARLVQ